MRRPVDHALGAALLTALLTPLAATGGLTRSVEPERLTEIGANDFRISFMGDPEDPGALIGRWPAVAYNSTDREFLVVWSGEWQSPACPLGAVETEIFVRRVDAASGQLLGPAAELPISSMGPDCDSAYEGLLPAAAYNAVAMWSQTTPLVSPLGGPPHHRGGD